MNMSEVLITSLLDAMKFGSREARMLFPSLLQLDDIANLFLELFVEKVCCCTF